MKELRDLWMKGCREGERTACESASVCHLLIIVSVQHDTNNSLQGYILCITHQPPPLRSRGGGGEFITPKRYPFFCNFPLLFFFPVYYLSFFSPFKKQISAVIRCKLFPLLISGACFCIKPKENVCNVNVCAKLICRVLCHS